MEGSRHQEPGDGDERAVLLGWLAFHRDALAAKCAGVADSEVIRAGLGGSSMSLLGLVRHMTEMERVYGVYALGGGEFAYVYGPYEDGQPEGDFDNLSVDIVEPSIAAWRSECAAHDALLDEFDMGDPGRGNRRSLRWNLIKLVQEYARHNGHADLIRQSIDGSTGE